MSENLIDSDQNSAGSQAKFGWTLRPAWLSSDFNRITTDTDDAENEARWIVHHT